MFKDMAAYTWLRINIQVLKVSVQITARPVQPQAGVRSQEKELRSSFIGFSGARWLNPTSSLLLLAFHSCKTVPLLHIQACSVAYLEKDLRLSTGYRNCQFGCLFLILHFLVFSFSSGFLFPRDFPGTSILIFFA